MGRVTGNQTAGEARRIVEQANQRDLALRLMGGVAVFLRCPPGEMPGELERDYVDLDFAGLSKETPGIVQLFSELGYQPNRRFNAVLGSERLLFNGEGDVDHIDVIIDQLRMCHTWDLRPRLRVEKFTLPLADLLLSKLQVVDLTEKDLKDIALLLLFHELGPGDQEQINAPYLASRLGSDWGLWRTVTFNLQKGLEYLEKTQFKQRELVKDRFQALLILAETAPKSAAWKVRSVIGERVKWYELPENVKH
jgi:hypothetical protein